MVLVWLLHGFFLTAAFDSECPIVKGTEVSFQATFTKYEFEKYHVKNNNS